MRLSTILTGMTILLTGCVTTMTNYYQRTVGSWKGNPVNPLLHRLGRSDRVKTCAFLLLFFSITSVSAKSSDESSKDEIKSYHVYEDVDLVSTLKFQYARPRIVVKSVYPQLQSNDANESIDSFNQIVSDFVQQKVTEFKENVAQIQPQLSKLSHPVLKNDLYIDFATSFIQSGHYPILSIRFNIQGNIAGKAHPYHHHTVLNYDIKNGDKLELSDLFNPDADYLQAISNYTSDVLRQRHLSNPSMINQGTAPRPDNFKNWNVKPNGILITFDEYQVAPSVEGTQTVLVPYSVLKDYIKNDSPILSCVKHPSRCSQSHVQTGGFIDEASNSNAVDLHHRLLNPILGKR